MGCLLEVRDLHVTYRGPEGREIQAVSGVSFAMEQGEVLGVLGESGSGKSTLAAALLRLLPPGGRIAQGAVVFEGQDLLSASADELQSLRGRRIALILQEPSASLHPTMRVLDQIAEIVRAHGGSNSRACKQAGEQALAAVFGPGAERIGDCYPHELSGGQRQRVLIAQAVVCRPSVVLADEPTASLDPSTQLEILELFRALRREYSLALVWITHNPALLAGFADRVLVMYAGKAVEWGPARAVLSSPQHPYTQALLQCMPAPRTTGARSGSVRLPVIAGDAPNAAAPEPGCPFEPRCGVRMDVCTSRMPAPVAVAGAHNTACFKYGG